MPKKIPKLRRIPTINREVAGKQVFFRCIFWRAVFGMCQPDLLGFLKGGVPPGHTEVLKKWYFRVFSGKCTKRAET